MFAIRSAVVASAAMAALAFAPLALALDPPAGRVEGKRADLAGAPGMEVITSVTTLTRGIQSPCTFIMALRRPTRFRARWCSFQARIR